jgi:HSP20 family protein
MAIRRWEPFAELMSLRDAMDRLFEEGFTRPTELMGLGTMPIDVYQTDKDVIVKANIPGVKPDDIDINVVGDTLTIKGERKAEEKIERQNYFYQERRFGTFSRTLTLPVPVQTDKADARFENGVLTLTLPKAEEAKAKKIAIRK